MTQMTRTIPLAKPLVGEAERDAVIAVLESGQLAQGSRVAQLEADIAGYTGVEHAIAVNSGTAALVVALQAHGVGAGDEVITTPFSFIATATSIIATGATPVFADISDDDFNLDPDRVRAAITERTRAVMPVHLYGNPARIVELRAICDEHGLALIEDAAQAHGAEVGGQRVGSFGTGAFSFYPTKNMTTGEGGIITTNDAGVAERAKMIRNHGQRERYRHDLLGLNWRMTDLAAAIGLVQLGHLEEWNNARIANASRLTELIDGLELPPGAVRTPRVREGEISVFHPYTVRIRDHRDAVQEGLTRRGIGTAIHYPLPIHEQPVIVDRGLGEGSFPVAEQAAREVLSLPVHPSLAPEDLEHIATALGEAVAEAIG
jgi:dTDP-4-amino-4,6-dideoxygalactose transaminase